MCDETKVFCVVHKFQHEILQCVRYGTFFILINRWAPFPDYKNIARRPVISGGCAGAGLQALHACALHTPLLLAATVICTYAHTNIHKATFTSYFYTEMKIYIAMPIHYRLRLFRICSLIYNKYLPSQWMCALHITLQPVGMFLNKRQSNNEEHQVLWDYRSDANIYTNKFRSSFTNTCLSITLICFRVSITK